jgi:hypothetical protein
MQGRFSKAAWIFVLRDVKGPEEEKMFQKSTYPPPANGPCVLFLCKCGCRANEAAAQAGRGALQAIVHCTECKVLKGNAVRLHSGARGGLGSDITEVPSFIGRELLKRGFACVFRFSINLFCRHIPMLTGADGSATTPASRVL